MNNQLPDTNVGNLNFQPIPKRFMVWNKEYKKFLDQPLDMYEMVIQFSGREIDLMDDEDVNRYLVCQSTNLFDKDGKEVFEGSIICSRNRTYIIEQLDGCWMAYDIKTHKVTHLWKLGLPLEAIGHILSDGELLEKMDV